MCHWIETVLSVLYSLNVLIGAVGYIPMLIRAKAKQGGKTLKE